MNLNFLGKKETFKLNLKLKTKKKQIRNKQIQQAVRIIIMIRNQSIKQIYR